MTDVLINQTVVAVTVTSASSVEARLVSTPVLAMIASGVGGTTDHGLLTGLADDDHAQYHTDARGDARYAALAHGHVIAGVTGLQARLDGKVGADPTALRIATSPSDVTVQVSPNGSTWTDALVIDRTTGKSTFKTILQWLGDTLTGIVPWRYVPPTTDPTAPKFNFSVTSGQWTQGPPGEPNYWDHTASLGWNFVGATRENPSQSAFGLTFESKFYQGTFGHEFHLQQTDSAGVSHRPLSFFLPTDGGAGMSGGLAADVVYLQTYNGAERVTFNLAGTSPVMHLLNNVQIWSNANNNSVFRQLNAAGNSYLALPYYNSENRLILAGPARFVAAIAPGQYTAVEAIITSASAYDTLYNIAGPAVTGGLTGFQCAAPVTDDFQSICFNSCAGSATIIARVSAGSTQDPRIRFERNGVAHWTMGIDCSDGNKFKIGGYTLDTTTKLTIDANRADWAVPVKLPSYTVATVPSAATAGAGAQIYVSNEIGGPVPAFSDGTNWRRVTDRAVVS